ncbi:BGTF surface domain-containing protein [Natrarchaeobius oligotrophus]|uniref:PGF-CTERM sorting domain-containing protein n=1 Tax=Natrarchaeobius chitinivorans TaxID=1679083 RepID=A0A3N6M4R5_NATCH|nr:BGTF surface domain-containing protein [Natrarchaeobius chitinivorans]RQG98533.1 PGF-CTERM sorting domain-containing protein [Natrarchaeobius chitinivorans]
MSEISYREKGRAVFLAAIMVLSVVAMSTAFIGGAAAADAELNSGSTYWQGQELEITGNASDVDADEELQIREYDGDGDIGGLQDEFSLEGGEAIIETDGLDDADYVVTLADDRNQAIEFTSSGEATLASDADSAYFEITSQSLDVDIADGEVNNGANSVTEVDVDSNRGSYSLIVEEADGDLSSQDLFNIFVDNDSVSNELSATGASDVDELYEEIRDGHSDTSLVYDNLSAIDSGASYHTFGEFEVSLVEGEDEYIVFNDINDREHDVDFEGIAADEYELEFSGHDSTAEDSVTIEVADEDVDVNFDQTVYTQTAGDVVEFTVELEDTDSAYIQFGDEDAGFVDILYVEDDEDDGEVTVQVNTRAVGVDSSADSEDVYDAGDDVVKSMIIDEGGDTTNEFEEVVFLDEDGDDLTATGHHLDDFVDELGISDDAEEQLVRPLQATGYDLTVGNFEFVVTDDGESELGNEYDLATLDLEPPGIDSIDTYVAPSNSADDEDDLEEVLDTVTQRTDIAEDDQLIIKAEASGIFGALVYEEGDWGALDSGFSADTLDAVAGDGDWEGEGINFDVSADDATGNQDATELDLAGADDDDVFVLADNDAGELYVIVDTSSSSAFDRSIEDGMDFTAELEYETDDDERYQFTADSVSDPWDGGADGTQSDAAYPYFSADSTQSVSASFTIVEPAVTFDNLDEDDNVMLETSDEFEVTGETNIAPGSEASVRIRNAGDTPSFLHTLEDTEIDSDGTFETEAVDLSDRSDGDEGELEFRISGSTIDNVDAIFVDEIPSDENDEHVDEGEDDNGDDADERTDEEDDNGDDADEHVDADDSTDDSTDESDDVPGFGVAVALVALLAAAMLALRRQH